MADTPPPPYTEADVEQFARAALARTGWTMPLDEGAELVQATLVELASARRLLPEGASVREQFGVMGDDPVYHRPLTMPKSSREEAERQIAEEAPDCPEYNLRLAHRMISDWQHATPPTINEESTDAPA